MKGIFKDIKFTIDFMCALCNFSSGLSGKRKNNNNRQLYSSKEKQNNKSSNSMRKKLCVILFEIVLISCLRYCANNLSSIINILFIFLLGLLLASQVNETRDNCVKCEDNGMNSWLIKIFSFFLWVTQQHLSANIAGFVESNKKIFVCGISMWRWDWKNGLEQTNSQFL